MVIADAHTVLHVIETYENLENLACRHETTAHASSKDGTASVAEDLIDPFAHREAVWLPG
jgi:hypothetical protein